MLIVVDDAHWADPASLRWLAYLASRVEGPGVAVVVALRPAELAGRQGPLAKIRRAAPAIRPGLLSAAGVAAIVRAALGAGHAGRDVPGATGGERREPVLPRRAAARAVRRGPGGGRLPASEAVARHVEARMRRAIRPRSAWPRPWPCSETRLSSGTPWS